MLDATIDVAAPMFRYATFNPEIAMSSRTKRKPFHPKSKALDYFPEIGRFDEGIDMLG
jgi:hypothetical protein